MSADSERTPRVLAGAPATDRRTFARRDAAERWFEPDHVRDPARVRNEMGAQVSAGADVLLAPTFLTHRRALLEVGESRRAREWTLAGVQVARESVELGLERRDAAAERLEVTRSDVVVLGVLPDLDAEPEPGTGRLAPREAATERDEADQVGILADAAVDAILVEPRASSARLGASAAKAADTGLDVWVEVRARTADPLEAWLESVLPVGPAAILLVPGELAGSATLVDRARREAGAISIGVVAARDVDASVAREWLEAGADLIGRGDGATPAALGPLVEARQEHVLELRRVAAEAQERWERWVGEAARRAPGGSALWLGEPPARLPDGFAWTVATVAAAASAPDEAFRLIVSTDPLEPSTAARLLEHGGIVAAAHPPESPLTTLAHAGLRLLHENAGWVMARRE
jgi:hypothetical protein